MSANEFLIDKFRQDKRNLLHLLEAVNCSVDCGDEDEWEDDNTVSVFVKRGKVAVTFCYEWRAPLSVVPLPPVPTLAKVHIGVLTVISNYPHEPDDADYTDFCECSNITEAVFRIKTIDVWHEVQNAATWFPETYKCERCGEMHTCEASRFCRACCDIYEQTDEEVPEL